MIAVIFEVILENEENRNRYLQIAQDLRPELDLIDGFISIERFQSVSDGEKMLSLSFWRDEEAIQQWRTLEHHRAAQSVGRNGVFQDYRLRIAGVVRDYGMHQRDGAPPDSRVWHDSTSD